MMNKRSMNADPELEQAKQPEARQGSGIPLTVQCEINASECPERPLLRVSQT